jgi:hypothetical protein
MMDTDLSHTQRDQLTPARRRRQDTATRNEIASSARANVFVDAVRASPGAPSARSANFAVDLRQHETSRGRPCPAVTGENRATAAACAQYMPKLLDRRRHHGAERTSSGGTLPCPLGRSRRPSPHGQIATPREIQPRSSSSGSLILTRGQVLVSRAGS